MKIISNPRGINIIFPDSVKSASDFIADFTLSPGCKASVNNTEQVKIFLFNMAGEKLDRTQAK